MQLCHKTLRGSFREMHECKTGQGIKRKWATYNLLFGRWTNTEESETSGVAVVEMHLPSGYFVMQDDLIRLVESRTVRNLRWAYRTDTQVKFFFNNVSTDVCPMLSRYNISSSFFITSHSQFFLTCNPSSASMFSNTQLSHAQIYSK